MIEIVKPNTEKTLIVCSTCKCEFMATVKDLEKVNFSHYITCPQCHERMEMKFYRNSSKFGKWWEVYHEEERLDEEKRQADLARMRQEKLERKAKAPRWKQILGLY